MKASTITEADAEAQTIAFINEHVGAKDRPVLAGNSIHQDRRFIRRYMPALDKRLHYRMVDVSTIKELARRWYPAADREAAAEEGDAPRARRHPRVDRRAAVLQAAPVRAAPRPLRHRRPAARQSSRLLDRQPAQLPRSHWRTRPGMSVARLPDMRTTRDCCTCRLPCCRRLLLPAAPAPTSRTIPRTASFVDDSKADDFFSTSAAEYIVEGKSTRHARRVDGDRVRRRARSRPRRS